MNKIEAILQEVHHRPWALPHGPWQYYQEWNKVLFLHWEVPFESLRKLVPEHLNLDSLRGTYYVSLVAFTMEKIRPRNMPSLKLVSDFHEINVRTYIDNDNKKGVYFLNIEAQKFLSAFIARKLSGLPYEKANIKRTESVYNSINISKQYSIKASYSVKEILLRKSELDSWLTERYCLYFKDGDGLYAYDIHHKAWEIRNVQFDHLSVDYKIGDIHLTSAQPFSGHYSKGVEVVAWTRQKVG